ncbi:MAG TPA: ATP-binding protein, partial [Burkholderiales bacterium]|nr:ATP-binding protein [Burkholderiales bacterium]
RVVQECLTNIARHARAHKVTVRVDQSPTALALEISDDGAGIDFAQIGANGIVTAGSGRRRSFGLLGLRERVTGLGGEFRLHSRPGAGTTVRVQIPRTTDSNPGVAA